MKKFVKKYLSGEWYCFCRSVLPPVEVQPEKNL